ncbi:hypothetical protein, partial [Tianweitania sp.]|uniref:hypothetical protein n=1 Tax=Tianweitania sp. TaxID=2021634 RepID=UPI002896ADA8
WKAAWVNPLTCRVAMSGNRLHLGPTIHRQFQAKGESALLNMDRQRKGFAVVTNELRNLVKAA